jgi:hypothetical protein
MTNCGLIKVFISSRGQANIRTDFRKLILIVTMLLHIDSIRHKIVFRRVCKRKTTNFFRINGDIPEATTIYEYTPFG